MMRKLPDEVGECNETRSLGKSLKNQNYVSVSVEASERKRNTKTGYVYLIQSINYPDKKYIGHTDNLKERLATHNSGGSAYTKDFKPWKLVMFLAFEDKLKATSFEKYLKSWAGRAFAKKRFW